MFTDLRRPAARARQFQQVLAQYLLGATIFGAVGDKAVDESARDREMQCSAATNSQDLGVFAVLWVHGAPGG